MTALADAKHQRPFWTPLFILGLLFAPVNALGLIWVTSVGGDSSLWRSPTVQLYWVIIAGVCIVAAALRASGLMRWSSALICLQFAPVAAFILWAAYMSVT